ncbi:queuosine precursor transporter [Natranaeroarchaeum aerophilus]|uniref:Probable queuosine precursor transporter n=1 Tax=Natranaeroarchaeum aerophilus TaxID=2917711 RepID=A0AAE3K5K8_9EURY|nr:queuosine precursor transporter [Natranaeroarchaeum aerophilus]MCL9814046.1 queuosine precursor transporter [Natranaeroarchaeum aerophilus]
MNIDDTKAIFTAVFAGSVVLANVLAAKLTGFELPLIGPVAIPAGFVAFGLAYLASDLLVEYHGREYAAAVVNGTVLTLVLSYALVFMAIWMPTAPVFEEQEAFAQTLGDSASIILASVVALALAQHLDVRLFSELKQRTAGRYRWVRNCGSTAVSQGVDTVVFITLGFAIFPALGLGGDPQWGWALASIVLGQYLVKLLVAAIDTVPFYAVTEIVDRTA